MSLLSKLFGKTEQKLPSVETATEAPLAFRLGAADSANQSELELAKRVADLDDSRRAIVNILEDLTAAKADVDAAKAYDDALLASIADGVIAVDPKGNIVEINRAVEGILGYSAADMRGFQYLDALLMYDGEGIPVLEEKRPFFLAMHAPEYTVFRDRNHFYRRKNGELFSVSVDCSPIFLNGKNVGAIEVFRDITQEKQIERAKNEFVSLASHQLRTPLTSIGWYSELLLGTEAGPLTEEQREYAKEIYAANKRMVQLVDALLNVSRIELGTFSIEPTEIDIIMIAHETVDDMAAPIARKNLHIDQDYDPTSIMMQVDGNLMRIIMQNLLSNAVKYTPPNGQIKCKIRIIGDRVVISVTDSGIGIPKEVQSKIFDKMYRADNARIADPDGNGLGLYLVKSIIDNSGGTVSFVSEEGKGSTFSISFPRSGMVSRLGQRKLQPSTPVKSIEELV